MNEHDDIDVLLARELAANRPLLPDDGFSAGVMAALPPVQPEKLWRKRLLLTFPPAAVAALVFSQGATGRTLLALGQGLFAEPMAVMQTCLAISGALLLSAAVWLGRDMGLT